MTPTRVLRPGNDPGRVRARQAHTFSLGKQAMNELQILTFVNTIAQ